jgi:phospholipid/cholesterol/gamma-HCH transport system ATP-binding protein
MSALISFHDVSHSKYFENISFEIKAGSCILIKTAKIDENTALLHLISGLARPAAGIIKIQGRDISDLNRHELASWRHSLGIVPANGGLVSNLKMWENITLPLIYKNGGITDEETESGYTYLRQLNYSGNIMALPAHLSTYEKRVAAFIRGALKQSGLMIYSNCFDAVTAAALRNFISIIKSFHIAYPGRTTLFISSNHDIEAELPVDCSLSIH